MTNTSNNLPTTFDQLHRYLFDDKHARGELVQLQATYQQILKNHQYPQGVQILLGELLAATCLLTATLKFEGEISVQLQGDGPVAYMVINGNNTQAMRGIAKLQQDISTQEALEKAQGLKSLLGKGTMVITIRPKVGEAYQGVVALEHDSLAECLSHYFAVSEQIPTDIQLFVDNDQQLAAGILVQLLPDGEDKSQQQNDYEHLCQITNTLQAKEIFGLSANDLLYRLYHQEQVRLYEPQAVSYVCGCSEEKCLTAISQVKAEELREILAEQGKVSMTCEYCQTTYNFDENKLAPLLTSKH